jgi:hypothetical protein
VFARRVDDEVGRRRAVIGQVVHVAGARLEAALLDRSPVDRMATAAQSASRSKLTILPIWKRGSSNSMAGSTPYQPPTTQIVTKRPPKLPASSSRSQVLQATCRWPSAWEMLW